jgi:hypothetical protein
MQASKKKSRLFHCGMKVFAHENDGSKVGNIAEHESNRIGTV